MKELIEKREELVAKAAAIQEKRTSEKRSTYTQDEFTELNSVKQEIEEIDATIKAEKDIEEKRNAEFDVDALSFNIVKKENRTDDIVKATDQEFVKFINNRAFSEEFRGIQGKFLVPVDYFKRATVTSAAAHQAQTQTLPVSIIEKNLVLESLGASLTYETGTGLKANHLGSSPAVYGTEDNAILDQTYSAGSYDMLPNYSRAAYTISGLRLKQMAPATVSAILGSNQNRILQGLQKRTIDHAVANSANIITGSSATTYYKSTVDAIAGIEFGNAFLFSKAAAAQAKQARKDVGSGRFVFDNGDVTGYKGVESSLLTGNTYVFADWSLAQMNIWQTEVEIVKDVLGGKGNYLIVSDAWSDGVFGNPYGSYVVKSTDDLLLVAAS